MLIRSRNSIQIYSIHYKNLNKIKNGLKYLFFNFNFVPIKFMLDVKYYKSRYKCKLGNFITTFIEVRSLT